MRRCDRPTILMSLMSLLRQRLDVIVHHRISMIAAFPPVLFDDPIVLPKRMTCLGWETRYPEQR
jgi:hypothetical protein